MLNEYGYDNHYLRGDKKAWKRKLRKGFNGVSK
jgi:hypothetical protein